MSGKFEGKVALVTGGGSGIGKAIVQRLSVGGAKFVIADLDIGAAEQVAATLDGDALCLKTDVSDPASVEDTVKRTVERFGRLDLAVNNAGIGHAMTPIGEFDLDVWRKVMAVNLDGVFYGMRYQIPAMLAGGGGAIVNLASIMGQVAMANGSAYVATKHAVVGLTKTAALEYAAKGIRVNAVGPAFIDTPLLTKGLEPEMLEGLAQLHPVGRLGQPEEVAALVCFLLSEDATFSHGGYYPVDGGYLAQ